MTSYKISQLTAKTAPAAADLLVLVDSEDTSTPPAGSAGSNKKTTVAELAAAIIDGTASDIQPPGQLAAGSSGLAADAEHAHPALDVSAALPGSLLAWNYPPWALASSATPSQSAGTNGSLYFLKIYLPYATTVTNLNFYISAAGSGATVDAAYAGLCNSSGTVVAASTNRSSDSALTSGAPSTWTAPLSSPYAAAAGTYYALLLIYMNTSGTNPAVGMVSNRAGNAGQSAGAYPGIAAGLADGDQRPVHAQLEHGHRRLVLGRAVMTEDAR